MGSLHTVDVRLMVLKRLNVLSRAHVPHIGFLITPLTTNTCKHRGNKNVIVYTLKYTFLKCLSHRVNFLLTPETKVFPVSDGARSRDKTSAVWPWKLCSSCPLSTSHNAHVPSPLQVRICHKHTCTQPNIWKTHDK